MQINASLCTVSILKLNLACRGPTQHKNTVRRKICCLRCYFGTYYRKWSLIELCVFSQSFSHLF